MVPVIPLNRGSSVSFAFTWPDGAGGGADVSGYDIVPYDVHPDLEGHLTLTWVNAALGTGTGTVAWQEDMPEGKIMAFRIRLVPKPAFPALLPVATPEIYVEVI